MSKFSSNIVPLSHPSGTGQRDTKHLIRDSAGTMSGTVSLKLLAHKLLSRDKNWDNEDWHERFGERASILEFEGGLSRAEAEAKALENNT